MSETQPTIGVIGAAGWLGGAMARAWVASGVAAPERMILSFRNAPPSYLPQAQWTRDNQALVERSDVVVLSVRPQDWPALAISASDKLVVSVMAGVPMRALAARLGSARIVRAMPNAAAEVGYSYTPWFAGPSVTPRDRQFVAAMMSAIGTHDEVADERQVDYLAGFSGPGPAYPALLAEAMIADAVARGFAPEVARRAATATLIGAGRLLERETRTPEEIVRVFVDYRGVSAAGVETMRARGFAAAVRDGLAAALAKSEAMARETDVEIR